MNKLILGLIFVVGFMNFEVNAQQKPQTSVSGNENTQSENRKKDAGDKEKNIAETNAKISQFLSEGLNAYNEKKYELAIEKFDAGFKLDPDFWGTAPVFLNDKALALRAIGVKKYSAAIDSKLNPALEANQYFLDSVIAIQEAQKILDESEVPTNETSKLNFEKTRLSLIKELAESYKLLVSTDKTRIYEAVKAFENYIKIEKDEQRKQKAQEDLKSLKSENKIDF